LEQALEPYPILPSAPEDRIHVDEAVKFKIIDHVRDTFAPRYDVTDVDGVRVDFGDGWGVVRASNTEPAITTRFEARTPERVAEIRALMLAAVEEFQQLHSS
jgi:phosphomannomutase